MENEPQTIVPTDTSASRLKAGLLEKDLTPAEFSRKLCISPVMTSRWLNGRHEPSMVYKRLIREELNIAL